MTIIAKGYQKRVELAENDIKANFDRIGGASSWIASQKKENCPNSMVGEFVVTGENGYSERDSHLSAALVRIRCVHNATTIWHVKEDGKRSRVLTA